MKSKDGVQVLLNAPQAAHLDSLDAQLQHLMSCRAREMNTYTKQHHEDKLLGNLVHQREPHAFLQIHQHLQINTGAASDEGLCQSSLWGNRAAKLWA